MSSSPTIPADEPASSNRNGRISLVRWAWLSIAAALITLALKFGAWGVTGSVSLLSDAIESSVNLVAAITALFALWFSMRPVDRSHNYGHEKIEFFASAVEGGLILLAGGGIIWYASQRLLNPQPLESIGVGIAITLVSAVVNFVVARMLLRVGREHDSIVLETDGQHLMTDVWTSLGVVVGIALVAITDVSRLDPAIAIIIALNILRTGVSLLRKSFDGLMDKSLPREEEDLVRAAVQDALDDGETFHALRTRKAGATRFVDLHVLLPGATSLKHAHDTSLRIEERVERSLPGTEVTIHLEPLESPEAWTDSELILVEAPNVAFDLPDFLQPLIPDYQAPASPTTISTEAP
jgi:cation diffusion facilitator family transporter